MAGAATLTSLGPNVKLELDSTIGVASARYDLSNDDLQLTTTEERINLHLVDRAPTLQTGAGQNQSVVLSLSDSSAKGLAVDDVLVVTREHANQAIGKVDHAIVAVSSQRAGLGAMKNRLDHTQNNVTSMAENLTAAESRIQDLDMAKETLAYSKASLLLNSSYNIMSQARSMPEKVLQLLQR